LPCLFSPRRKL